MQPLELIRKYDVPGPRYTSYPTVPFWDVKNFNTHLWIEQLSQLDTEEGISIYVHLPYCESLCTYCGCNTRITKNHGKEKPYIDALLKEWEMVKTTMNKAPQIKEIHLGGGTPTFFGYENLTSLIKGLLVENRQQPEISIEAHPNNTTLEHLAALYHFGARRVSFGIQDFDPDVQALINRIQPVAKVIEITRLSRELGYKSVNFDLIYGLPGQTIETVSNTIKETIKMHPDRIAFYSYAHVPWLKPAQRSFEAYLPSASQKRQLYEMGKSMLEENGYIEIGMDHFALPKDDLAVAFKNGRLHRNFMGYTTQKTNTVIGLGASSISDVWNAFAQNEKNVEKYLQMIQNHQLPIIRGHLLSEQEMRTRQQILDIMCQFTTTLNGPCHENLAIKNRLQEMEDDALITWDYQRLIVNEKGKPYIRNVCMAFDQYLWNRQEDQVLFSKTV